MLQGVIRILVIWFLVTGNFGDSNLTSPNFTNADLTGADFSTTTMTSPTWSNTTCPDGTNMVIRALGIYKIDLIQKFQSLELWNFCFN